jgi:hypothetical protein
MPILPSQGLRSSSSVDRRQLNNEPSSNGSGVNAFGEHANHPGLWHADGGPRSAPYPVGQNITYWDSTGVDMSILITFNDLSSSLLDWDKMMDGPKLNQQRNYSTLCRIPMISV